MRTSITSLVIVCGLFVFCIQAQADQYYWYKYLQDCQITGTMESTQMRRENFDKYYVIRTEADLLVVDRGSWPFNWYVWEYRVMERVQPWLQSQNYELTSYTTDHNFPPRHFNRIVQAFSDAPGGGFEIGVFLYEGVHLGNKRINIVQPTFSSSKIVYDFIKSAVSSSQLQHLPDFTMDPPTNIRPPIDGQAKILDFSISDLDDQRFAKYSKQFQLSYPLSQHHGLSFHARISCIYTIRKEL